MKPIIENFLSLLAGKSDRMRALSPSSQQPSTERPWLHLLAKWMVNRLLSAWKAGFGYDPLFVVAGKGKTMAELSADEKAGHQPPGTRIQKVP